MWLHFSHCIQIHRKVLYTGCVVRAPNNKALFHLFFIECNIICVLCTRILGMDGKYNRMQTHTHTHKIHKNTSKNTIHSPQICFPFYLDSRDVCCWLPFIVKTHLTLYADTRNINTGNAVVKYWSIDITTKNRCTITAFCDGRSVFKQREVGSSDNANWRANEFLKQYKMYVE